MLTQVTLYGRMAKEFGRDWELDVSSPAEALQLIEANKPGFKSWMRNNLATYDSYKVIVEYHDGRKEDLDEDTFKLERLVKRMRFIPLISGAGGGFGKIILGALLIATAFFFPVLLGAAAPYVMGAGISLAIGGVIELISPRPKKPKDQGMREDGTSYFFDGPVNTTQQGVPVPLIYGGPVLCGSHPISAKVTVDQLL